VRNSYSQSACIMQIEIGKYFLFIKNYIIHTSNKKTNQNITKITQNIFLVMKKSKKLVSWCQFCVCCIHLLDEEFTLLKYVLGES
jgi:hypothetical protein